MWVQVVGVGVTAIRVPGEQLWCEAPRSECPRAVGIGMKPESLTA